MNRPDFLSQLPSLEELLEHPRVSAAINRVNHSAAATQVRGAITGLMAEASRRAEALSSLGAGELLDRLIRQLEFPRHTASSGVVNATGQFFAPRASRPPLAPAAIEAAHLAADGFRPERLQAASDAAAKLLGADAACVFSSPVRALETTLEALAGGGACVVARGDMTEPAPGVRLDELCRRSGVALREVGAADTATPDDYRRALEQLQAEGVERRVVLVRGSAADTGPAFLSDLVGVAGQGGASVVADRGRARPRRDTPAYQSREASVEETLAGGVAAVLFDAAGLVGGPVAGVVAGGASVLDVIAGSSAAKADAIDPMVDAALAATLGLFERPGDLRFAHPLHQLLDAPVENLRQRAERIAARLGAQEGVATAAPVERANALRGAAWGVRIEPAGASAAELSERLAGGDPAVVAETDGSGVVLDLSTVFPAQDLALVSAFGPDPASEDDSAGANGVG